MKNYPLIFIAFFAGALLVLILANKPDGSFYGAKKETDAQLMAKLELSISLSRNLKRIKKYNIELIYKLKQRPELSLDDKKKIEDIAKSIEEFYEKLESIKRFLIEKGGKQNYGFFNAYDTTSYLGSDLRELYNADDIDIVNTYMTGTSKSENMGEKLRDALKKIHNEYDESLLLINSRIQNASLRFRDLPISVSLEPKRSRNSWESELFKDMDLATALSLLWNYELMAAESENMLLERWSEYIIKEFDIDGYELVIDQNRSSVIVGGKIETRIFLAAKAKIPNCRVKVDGKDVLVENGVGKFYDIPPRQGEYVKKVELTYIDPKTGTTEPYFGQIEYTANRAPAIISLDKMNVVYTNLENPISISIPGFYPESINASLSPVSVGSLHKVGPGMYNAKINKRDRNGCNIYVSVKLPDGSTKPMGTMNYRTMKVPMPTPSLNGNSGNKISVGALRSIKALSVVLEDFVYEGIRYQVESFGYRYYKKSGELTEGSSDSRVLPDELSLVIENAATGDFIVFYNIKASAPQIGEIEIPGAMAFEIE
jgi:hypothetical protein